ncbi:hypothetical protein HYN51_03650 [Limnobaculum parvum]|uniref:Uncharacterized protein n=1 Tax=Limnobaculum parvum TaxID=2172103 RepID=A0A2Y9TVJ8_9GAMM|nr:hypothetical protein HYN51_03650 [Limnobaculum parvum]
MPVLAEESSVVKGGIKTTVSGVIAAGKEAFSGMKEGVDDGRQSGGIINYRRSRLILSNNSDDI